MELGLHLARPLADDELKPCWAIEGGQEAIRETDPCAGWASLIGELGVMRTGHATSPWSYARGTRARCSSGCPWGPQGREEAEARRDTSLRLQMWGGRVRHSPGCAHRAGVTRSDSESPKLSSRPLPQAAAWARARGLSLPWRQRHLVAPRPRGGRPRPHGGTRRHRAGCSRAAPHEGAWHQGSCTSCSVCFHGVFQPFRGQKHRLNLVKVYILVYVLCNTKL